MDELAGTENRISVARRDYNDAVQSFNTRIKTFPTSIIAGMFGFSSKEYFRVEEGAKQVPAVKFLMFKDNRLVRRCFLHLAAGLAGRSGA